MSIENTSLMKAMGIADGLVNPILKRIGTESVSIQIYPMVGGRSAIVFHDNQNVLAAYSVGANGDFCKAEIK